MRYLYSSFLRPKQSQSATEWHVLTGSHHIVLPATHTTILTLLRKHSPDGTAQTRQNTFDIAYYSIYRPRKDERLSWPSWLTYSGRFTHISGHPSAAGRARERESSPFKERSITVQRNHHGPTWILETHLRGSKITVTGLRGTKEHCLRGSWYSCECWLLLVFWFDFVSTSGATQTRLDLRCVSVLISDDRSADSCRVLRASAADGGDDEDDDDCDCWACLSSDEPRQRKRPVSTRATSLSGRFQTTNNTFTGHSRGRRVQ